MLHWVVTTIRREGLAGCSRIAAKAITPGSMVKPDEPKPSSHTTSTSLGTEVVEMMTLTPSMA